MTSNELKGKQQLLRIYVDEGLKTQHQYVWKFLLERARGEALAGCTVVKGFAGFDPEHGFHSEFMFDGAGDSTMILELVDEPKKLDHFIKSIEHFLTSAVVVKEEVFVRHYSHLSSGQVFEKLEAKMETSGLNGKQTLLRVFLGESDKIGHHPLYTDILNQARKNGIAGATVTRGVAGFGASSVIHEPHLFKLSSDMPIVIEIVDAKEKVKNFMNHIEPLLKGALVTEEEIEVRHYGAKK